MCALRVSDKPLPYGYHASQLKIEQLVVTLTSVGLVSAEGGGHGECDRGCDGGRGEK